MGLDGVGLEVADALASQPQARSPDSRSQAPKSMLRPTLVAIGGLFGSLARYWISGAVQQLCGSSFPFGTLSVNILGSFALGMIASLSIERGLLSQEARLLLGVGFCGGFTTMSAFSYESIALLRDGNWLSAFWNVGATIGTCFTGVWLGGTVGRII